MKIHLPKKRASGYTIIELIISIFILILIFTVAQTNYRGYILNKSLDAARSQMISDIRLAQEYALAGRKSLTCSGLNGYTFTLNAASNATSYLVRASCGGSFETVKSVSLSIIATNVTANYSGSTGTTNGILFKILGQGNDISTTNTNVVITLSQETSGYSRAITISQGGEIK